MPDAAFGSLPDYGQAAPGNGTCLHGLSDYGDSAELAMSLCEATKTVDDPAKDIKIDAKPEPKSEPKPGWARPGDAGYAQQQAYLEAMKSPYQQVTVGYNDPRPVPSPGGGVWFDPAEQEGMSPEQFARAYRRVDCVAMSHEDVPAFCKMVPVHPRDVANPDGLDPVTAALFRACFREIPDSKRAELYAKGGLKLVRAYALRMADNAIKSQYPAVGWARWLKSWFVRPHKHFRP